jgi:hypothetical protein
MVSKAIESMARGRETMAAVPALIDRAVADVA